MKKIICLFTFILLVSCSNDNNEVNKYKSVGVLEGLDMAMCACCGGYIIIIENKRYLIQNELPNQENLDLKNLPIDVKLNWEFRRQACDDNIIVYAIEQIQVVD